MNKNLLNKKAFTIAEVIIVLGIIGIVAQMTIPNMIKNTQEAQYKTLFKKEYSVASSAFRQAATDNGGTLAGYSTLTGDNYDRANDFKDVVKPYLSYIKDCKRTDGAKCFPPGVVYHTYTNTDFPSGWAAPSPTYLECPALVLKDGSIWWFDGYYDTMGSCTADWLKTKNSCGRLRIDTNGAKKPNQAGYDFFEFHVAADGTIVPMGTQNDAYKDNYAKDIGYNPRANYMLGIEN